MCIVQLVAKLKSIFDRFDANSVGRLSGAQVEQMLVYMNRPVGSVQVNDWLQRLKDKEDSIEFPEFVAQYSVGALHFEPLQSASYFACSPLFCLLHRRYLPERIQVRDPSRRAFL
jgi:Ca2+-binding EF-hand superfamily protein